MAEDQRPRGELGLPRLTDIGPLVSHHNTPATECDKKVCFGGHTKGEVFKSIQTAFINHRDEFKQDLRGEDFPVEEIVISGSVVTGNFGCRDVNKAKDEISELVDLIWRERREMSKTAVEVGNNIARMDSIIDMWEAAQNGFKGEDNEDILKEDIRTSICSDIDIFVLVPDDLLRDVRQDWRRPPITQIKDKHTSAMFNDTKGEMIYIENLESKEFIEEDVIFTEEGFDEIIRRHY